MSRPARSIATLAATAAAVVALSACGSDANPKSSAESRLAQITAAVGTPSSSSSAHTSGPTIDLASVDVCALLSAAEANRVARAADFDPLQTSSTVYEFSAMKQPGGCKIKIVSPEGGAQGSAVFHVASAKGFTVPPNGKPITGLGNEAYDTGVSPVVRVGNVKIYPDDNSFPDSMSVALLRAMVPKLK